MYSLWIGGQMKKKQVVLTEESILLNMPRKLKERVDRFADTRGMAVTVAIRMILDERITQEEKQLKQ